MIQRFTKKELVRLGCTNEEISMIMKYQKLLPMPDKDFEMNARTLHVYLCVGKRVTTWIQGRIEKYKFKEDVDYMMRYESDAPILGSTDFTGFTATQLSRMGVKKEYYLTVNMCKELCTIENNELGRLARRYFILMGSIVVRNKYWWDTRNPQRANYKPLCEALSAFTFKMCGKTADDAIYAREANILNVISTGCTAQEIKLYLGVSMNELTRDNLQNDYNSKIDFLQKQDIICLGMDMSTLQRVHFLIGAFDITYPDALPIKSYKSREYLIAARENLINDLSK